MDAAQEEDGASAIGDAAFVLMLREHGTRDTAVLRAMEQVPREAFVPEALRAHARRDIALPLPHGQSMNAPTTVAAMLAFLGVPAGGSVLEIGTGSGYVTALLVQLGSARIRSIERHAGLAESARARFGDVPSAAGFEVADGLDGETIGDERFDRILLNGAWPEIPAHLGRALNPGGRAVGAVFDGSRTRLVIVDRAADGRFGRRIDSPRYLPALAPGTILVS